MEEYRLYTMINWYLSPIQQGIQSAHIVHELFTKYENYIKTNSEDTPKEILYDWANNHKTMIVLNGGANHDIIDKQQLINFNSCGLPYAHFCEDSYSLGNVMTGVGVVIPNRYYDAKISYNDAYVFSEVCDGDSEIIYRKGTYSWNLINMIKSCGLAK